MVEMPGIEPGSNVSVRASYCHVSFRSSSNKNETKSC